FLKVIRSITGESPAPKAREVGTQATVCPQPVNAFHDGIDRSRVHHQCGVPYLLAYAANIRRQYGASVRPSFKDWNVCRTEERGHHQRCGASVNCRDVLIRDIS